jgi:hypothetical protein
MNNRNRFCPYCLSVFSDNYICGTCSQPTISIGDRLRIPKKKANKKKWKDFFKKFPYFLSHLPKTKILKKKGVI